MEFLFQSLRLRILKRELQQILLVMKPSHWTLRLFVPVLVLSAAMSLAASGCSASDRQAVLPTASKASEGRASVEVAAALPKAPLKIPFEIDKAGYKSDVTFEVPPPDGKNIRGYFVGLRVLFSPAMGQVQVIDENAVAVRLLMSRVDHGKEEQLTFVKLVNTAKPLEDSKFEALPIQNGTAISTGRYTDHSGAPPGTPDASTYVLSFAAAIGDDEPGIYRLQVETLNDLPALKGFKAFLVYEQLPNR